MIANRNVPIMIVSDKAKTLLIANELSNQILMFVSKESEKLKYNMDDPAEHIYLACHIFGMLLCKVSVAYADYGTIYAIPNLTKESIHEWIIKISDEYANGLKITTQA